MKTRFFQRGWRSLRQIRFLILPLFFTAEFFFCKEQAPNINLLAHSISSIFTFCDKEESSPTLKPCIVIDPGHGGKDPGKIGINQALEKDLNLSISQKLAPLFEDAGFRVCLTRETDCDLASEHAVNSKIEDLDKRIALIEKEAPLLVISIHQNSFSDSSAMGPQVFYYENSCEGEALARNIQEALNQVSFLGTNRSIMSNSSYYMLKKTPTPTVIVECGFLSNWSEAEMLEDADYQKQLCDAIVSGTLSYLDTINNSTTKAPASTE